MPPEIERVRALFRERGIRCTRQREVVYRALVSTDSHPSAEELFSAVRVSDPGLSLATVYNALETFVDAGICRRLPGPQSPRDQDHGPPTGVTACRFDAQTHEHAHVEVDGELLDAPDDLSDRLLLSMTPKVLRELERRLGVVVERVAIQIVARKADGPDARDGHAGSTPAA